MTPVTGGGGLPFQDAPGGTIPSAPADLDLTAYWVMLYERDHPSRQIKALLGETPPTPTPSSGGGVTGDWNVVTLPKRAAVTIWQGRQNLILMTVPIILGHPGHGPVHPAHNALSSMWRPSRATTEPPVVKVRAVGDAVPYQSLQWVVTNIAWGDAIGGLLANRIMQKLTVTLLEYRGDEILQETAAARPLHRARTYVVHHGDTLATIARKFRVKGGWQAIGRVQHPPIRDPRKIRVGQRLLIP